MSTQPTIQERLAALLAGIRPNAEHAVSTFVDIVPLDGVPATLIITRPLKPGGPCEVACVDGMDIRPGRLYARSTG